MADFSLVKIAQNLRKKRGPLDLYGTGEIDPDFVGETSGKEAKKPGTDWKGVLGAGLMGAAGAIQADVGPAKPGAEWAQGLLKGIVGTGLVRSAMAQQEAEAAARDMAYQERKELAEAAAKAKPTAEQRIAFKVREQQALLPGLIKIQEAGVAIKTKAQKEIEEGKRGATEAEEREGNQWAAEMTQRQVEAANKSKKFTDPLITPEQRADMLQENLHIYWTKRSKPIKLPAILLE